MLFGNTQNINKSKYEIFIICSCEGLFGNILFLSSVPSAFYVKGEKWNTSKDVNQEQEKKWGGLIHVLLVFLSFPDSFHLSLGSYSG